MSSRFLFSRLVRETPSHTSPHSNRSNQSQQTPQSKATSNTPTSVSPHTQQIIKSCSLNQRPASPLKVYLPESGASATDNSHTSNPFQLENQDIIHKPSPIAASHSLNFYSYTEPASLSEPPSDPHSRSSHSHCHSHPQPPHPLHISKPHGPLIQQQESVFVNTPYHPRSNTLCSPQHNFLSVPSDSETAHSASPLVSEPSPKPASPTSISLHINLPLDACATSETLPSIPRHPLNKAGLSIELSLDDEEQEDEERPHLEVDSKYQASASFSAYPGGNHSPVSTTSTVDTPLYTGILEAQTSHLPDLALAPLDSLHLVCSPTPSRSADPLGFSNTANTITTTSIGNSSNPLLLEVVDETPTHCNTDDRYKNYRPRIDIKSRTSYLYEASSHYNAQSDSDYDFESDFQCDQTASLLLTDAALERELIAMGCCCSNGAATAKASIKQNTVSNDSTDAGHPQNQQQQADHMSNVDALQHETDATHRQNGKKSKKMQIKITSHPTTVAKEEYIKPRSFTDKYFRTREEVAKRNKSSSPKLAEAPTIAPNVVTMHKNNSDGNDEDMNVPPIPDEAPKPRDTSPSLDVGRSPHRSPQHAPAYSDVHFSLLGPTTEFTTTQSYDTEQKDLVSPIPALDKLQSMTNAYAKRASTSQLSSPLHSVRLSITPNGHMTHMSHITNLPYNMEELATDDEAEDISTTDSKEDQDADQYSRINTPVEFLKKSTITKFVSPQTSEASEKNVLSRKRRRGGVSERHTLTFSKPPLPLHELPQSPKFTEQPLDVNKPIDFLYKILNGNLLFSGVDSEFQQRMVNKVVDSMRAADFGVDEILMHQGAAGDAFYAVENGKFDILISTEQGEERKVAVAKRGDCVGEYALLYNQPRTATLKATEKSRVWGITAEQFTQMRQEIMDWNVERFEKRQQFIHSIPLFQNLEQHELLNMTHACHAELYEINDYIIKPGKLGQRNTNVYIIMEGTVVISYDGKTREMTDEHRESLSPIERGITDDLKLNSVHSGHSQDSEHNSSGGGIVKQATDTTNNQAEIPALPNDMPMLQDMDSGSNVTAPVIYTGNDDEDVVLALNMQTVDQPTSTKGIDNELHNTKPFASLDGDNVNKRETLTAANKPFVSLNGDKRDTLTASKPFVGFDDKRDTLTASKPLGFALSLSAVNSAASQQSIHIITSKEEKEMTFHARDTLSAVNMIDAQNRLGVGLIDMNVCRGDKELGPSDYFARNLFINPEYEDEEEIVCARAHTQCKVLKIARDDFILIMASQQSGAGQYIFNDSGIVGDGELPENKTWAHKRPDISLSDLEEKAVLGVGSFGKVTLVKHKQNGETFALKSVSKTRVIKTCQEEHIINEKRVLTMLDSPFCVRLFATFKTESTLFFLTEAVLGGELFTVLRYNEKFDKNATRFYAGCVILALEHLHSMDIIYRDLKPENLLLNRRGYLQLTDFGFAKKRNTTCTLCGTPQYLAPEVIHNWVQSFATDWWALGVLLYEMVVGHPPFEDDENIKMYEKILVHEPEFPKDLNSKLRHLISKLLEKNAYQRLGSGAGGARRVKQHPFFNKKMDWNELYEQKMTPPYKPNIEHDFDTSNFDHFSDYEESSDDEDVENLNASHFNWVQNF